MFLADAVAGFVESLSERELDAPLIALLHREGFSKVHLVHGPYEFGKDFIAQRVDDGVLYQYCFQSKGGDIGTSIWRDVAGQVTAMRTGSIVHPDFAPHLPRKLVVVCNGRLKGGAGVEFQSYNEYFRRLGEMPVEFWGIDRLTPAFLRILVDGVPVKQRSRTLEILGRIGLGRASRQELREYSTTWFGSVVPRDRWANVLSAALLAKEAWSVGREDLASQAAFLLMRSAWETEGLSSAQRDRELVVGRSLFLGQAEQLLHAVTQTSPIDVTLTTKSEFELFLTHRVKVARLCECLALLGIWYGLHDNLLESARIADLIEALCRDSPALSQPISDEWSFSVLSVGILFGMLDRSDQAEQLLRATAKWVLDSIEFGAGLASVGASEEAEVRQLLGVPYEHIDVPHEPASYALAVILDLARVLGLHDLYGDLVNDLVAVDAMATLVSYTYDGSVELLARVYYPPGFESSPAHHEVSTSVLPAAREGKFFDCIAEWATYRDRHLPALLAAVCRSSTP
jgi:hypothetical protein